MLETLLDAVAAREATLRLGAFVLVFSVVALLEIVSPRRRQPLGRNTRWPANLALTAANALALRLLIPITAVGIAMVGQENEIGLFNYLRLPGWFSFIATLVLMDLSLYLQHRLVHAVPLLWRLHRVHHADLEVDITTGARFHPLEMAFSLAVKVAVVAALGAPPAAVVGFEILLNATSMFNHGNLKLPPGLDGALRKFLVTPDMHRIHHSVLHDETNSNFGFNLTWWDYLLSTYRSLPAAGHVGMELGVSDDRAPERCNRFFSMLAMPFQRRTL